MRHAVVRVNLDPAGRLDLERALAVREALRAGGVEVVEAELTRSLAWRRELELVLAGDDPQEVRERALGLVAEAMRGLGIDAQPAPGAVTFKSAGTPDDALGILRAFGVHGEVRWATGPDEDSVVLVVRPEALQQVSESRLLTALQSGLNRGVTLVTRWEGPSERLDAPEAAGATPGSDPRPPA
ncbi:MAG TPA: hypothetical protein VKY90_11785 [Candidatus Dormibacteraeota bacterium]|nr:hypothetical protein [Candidatus Dormibacteraeota bacterium]